MHMSSVTLRTIQAISRGRRAARRSKRPMKTSTQSALSASGKGLGKIRLALNFVCARSKPLKLSACGRLRFAPSGAQVAGAARSRKQRNSWGCGRAASRGCISPLNVTPVSEWPYSLCSNKFRKRLGPMWMSIFAPVCLDALPALLREEVKICVGVLRSRKSAGVKLC